MVPRSLTTITPFSKLLALSLFILFPIVGFLLGMQFSTLMTRPMPQEVMNTNNMSKDTTIVLPEKTFKKRMVDKFQKIFSHNDSSSNPTYMSLPSINFQDKDLTSFDCSPYYEDNIYGPSNKYYYLSESRERAGNNLLTSDVKAKIVDVIKAKSEIPFVIQFCETEDGQVIVSYGSWEKMQFAVWNGREEIQNDEFVLNLQTVASLAANKEGTYHRCQTPLLFTKNNLFFIACDSSNGAIMPDKRKDFAYVYSVDLTNGKVELKNRCIRELDAISCSN